VGEYLALAGILVAILVGITPAVRRAVRRRWHWMMLRLGRPERTYTGWFIRSWGRYENPYLEDTEHLDLSGTYVSLSFQTSADGPGGAETRAAAAVLADRAGSNLIIEGGPGSGKSTLLKAYGVGVLRVRRGRLWRSARNRDVPFLVPLRKLTGDLDRPGALADYLINEILVSGAGLRRERAIEFLQHTLATGRALVMLDGLDEVTADRYRAVLASVHRFVTDRDPERPTSTARVVVTCRRRNFLSLRDEWVPAIAQTVCTLAPLRNSEIFAYLERHRAKFKVSDGPASFYQAVRAAGSGTLDLHRIPLVLAMSLGLHIRKDFFEIPGSIAGLYELMVREMLDRHRFKRDPGASAVRFTLDDKYRFLREFALAAASRPAGFDEFDKWELVDFARDLAPRLDAVEDRQLRAFVSEILDRSGLLSDVSEAGRYVFAHRSIQEFLVAEELRRAEDGAEELLGRVDDPAWQQVVLFYTAAQEQRPVDRFLARLAGRNPSLAGHCLAGAKASNEVAAGILDTLTPPSTDRHLAALVAAARSPRVAVREMAVSRLEASLPDLGDRIWPAGEDVEGVLPLLDSLAGTNAARIAALVPRAIEQVPDDPRLVAPLWRCLSTPGIECQPWCAALIQRLLAIAADPDGLAELQRQEPYTRDFLTDEVRQRSYPFRDGLPPASNLVTLLAWADYLEVSPAKPNRYFEAKAAGRLGRVETDRRRTISFSLGLPARVLSGLGLLAALTVSTVVLMTDPATLLRPFGWWSPLLSLGAGLAAFGILYGLSSWVDTRPTDSWQERFLDVPSPRESGNLVLRLIFPWPLPVGAPTFFGLPILYVVATAPLATATLPGYLAVAVAAPLLLYWLPLLNLAARTTRFYLYRPNEYIDVYDDPRSRHWVGSG
jgi:hypothetical protein